MSDFVDPIIYTDSAVVANHVNQKWVCKNPALVPLLMTIEEIKSEYRFRLIQVPRLMVAEADTLANQFLNNLQIRKDS